MKESEMIFGNPFRPETLERGITEPLQASVRFWYAVAEGIYKNFEKSGVKDVMVAKTTRFFVENFYQRR